MTLFSYFRRGSSPFSLKVLHLWAPAFSSPLPRLVGTVESEQSTNYNQMSSQKIYIYNFWSPPIKIKQISMKIDFISVDLFYVADVSKLEYYTCHTYHVICEEPCINFWHVSGFIFYFEGKTISLPARARYQSRLVWNSWMVRLSVCWNAIECDAHTQPEHLLQAAVLVGKCRI